MEEESMSVPLRWAISVFSSSVVFGVTWWGLHAITHLDSGVAVGVAVVPFTIVFTLGGTWAERERKRTKNPDPKSVQVANKVSGGVSGTLTGASFGPGGDFRNASIVIGGASEEQGQLQRRSHETSSKIAGLHVIFGDIPQRAASFQERAEVRSIVDNSSEALVSISVLTGPRGAGKTQIAAEIARQRIAEGWRVVAWIRAEDEALLISDLNQLAAELGLVDGQQTDLRSSSFRVRHWLETDGRQCLLVFDNVLDASLVRTFLPAAGQAQVIITGFRRTLANLGDPVTVNLFTPDQAAAFLSARTGRDDTQGALRLAQDLGYLPLALAQAAAVISGQRLDYETYRKRLAGTEIARYLDPIEGDSYPLGVAEAILLSLSAIEARDIGAGCRKMLELLSLLSASGVSRQLLYVAAQEEILDETRGCTYSAFRSTDDVDVALQELATSSLISWSIDGSSVSIHRLIARVVRERAVHDESIAAAGHLAIDVLSQFYERRNDQPAETVFDASELVSQAIALQQNLKLIEKDIAADYLVRFSLLLNYAAGYISAYLHIGALLLEESGELDQAITIMETVLPTAEEHGDTKGLAQIKDDLKRMYAKRAAQNKDKLLTTESNG